MAGGFSSLIRRDNFLSGDVSDSMFVTHLYLSPSFCLEFKYTGFRPCSPDPALPCYPRAFTQRSSPLSSALSLFFSSWIILRSLQSALISLTLNSTLLSPISSAFTSFCFTPLLLKEQLILPQPLLFMK